MRGRTDSRQQDVHAECMGTQPFFHLDSGEVRFFVEIDGESVGASITRQTLHYRFCRNEQGDDPLATYVAHADDIEAAVRRRVAGGSLKPVLLREFDLLPR